ncbi:MAG: Hsp20/alpha crystallin family protein [Victivallales bacterium]|nr:Hsp20/alpha crystallin family protein [Victivallales bacterium]
MLKKRLFTVGTFTLLLVGAIVVFAADKISNDDNMKKIQIQNAPSPQQSTSVPSLNNSSFADQIREMQQMQRQMNQHIKHTFNSPFFKHPKFDARKSRLKHSESAYPQIKYYMKNNDYVVQFIIPGMDKKNIKVELSEQTLTVSGQEEKTKKTEKDNNASSYYSTSKFSQSIRIPGNADTSAIKTKYENGILTITIPKAAKQNTETKVIPIN